MMRVHWAVALMAAIASFGLGRLSGSGGEELLPQQQALGSIEGELKEVFRLPFGTERVARYVAILGNLDDERVETIVSVFEQDLSEPSSHEIQLLVREWAEFAPEAAFDRALAWDHSAARVTGSAEAMEGWARHNPVAARLALDELEVEGQEIRGTLSMALVVGWVDSGVDPAGLGPYVSQLEGWDRERTARGLIDRLAAAGDYDAAMAWAEGIPRNASQNFRNLAFRKVALVVGGKDPDLVTRWLEPHREHRYGQAGFRVLGRAWAMKDPHAAMAWVAGDDQPNDRARYLFINFAFDTWYQDAPEEALEWLASMPGDELADPARMVLAMAEKSRDPGLAVQTALDVRDSAQRLDLLGKVLGSWSQRAPMDMAHWLKETDLAEPERALAESVMAGMESAQRERGPVRSGQGTTERVP